MFKKGYQVLELILVIVTLIFLYKLYFYKEYLSENIITKNYGVIKEAVLIVQEPNYFTYLLLGIIVLAILIGFTYYCIKYERDEDIELVIVVVFNIILTIIVLLVFWSPILTTLCVVVIMGLLVIKGIN